ncbi:MAG TPA: UDP-N-acetylmuramate dehydrogenase [Paraburkholderia sp.]
MSSLTTGVASEPGYTIVENASLEGRNTFRVPARAEILIDVRGPEALAEVLALPYVQNNPLLILGGGSNMLFTRDWPGVVLSIATHHIRVLEDREQAALVRVEAGENWNEFVHWSLSHGYVGLENLVLIPGSVGAAPIQNIGAYGREVSEFVAAVEAWDRQSGSLVRLDSESCRFTYRDSLFKHEPGRYLISAVEFLLPRHGDLRTDYAGITEELSAIGQAVTAVSVAEAVARLRTRKLPNPAVIGNAGSFFKNPVVTAAVAAQLKHAHPGLPTWQVGEDSRKLAAAWLIEASGMKGVREGDAGVSNQHALVLVNHGRATGAQIWALAQRVRDTVAGRFGVTLEPEPIIV